MAIYTAEHQLRQRGNLSVLTWPAFGPAPVGAAWLSAGSGRGGY
jgi:hypothetical protein